MPMTIRSRSYAGRHDLHKIQAATAHWISQGGFRGTIHPDAIALYLFNGMRDYDPREIVHLWEDSNQDLLGWGMVCPAWGGYEAVLHPSYRDRNLAATILEWAEGETVRWLREMGRDRILVEVFEGDRVRSTLLEQYGYVLYAQRHIISTRSLNEPIPAVPLPDGFRIRTMMGDHEADKLVVAQNAAFGWSWTTDEYRRVMQTPAGKAEKHLIVTAPDGRFGAFCLLLSDPLNALGMFENVGTHPDFRRLGLGKALLLAGFEKMKAQGLETVLVPHHPTGENEAATALYTAVGFHPIYTVLGYSKTLSSI